MVLPSSFKQTASESTEKLYRSKKDYKSHKILNRAKPKYTPMKGSIVKPKPNGGQNNHAMKIHKFRDLRKARIKF
jgi:hypothetical protein